MIAALALGVCVAGAVTSALWTVMPVAAVSDDQDRRVGFGALAGLLAGAAVVIVTLT